MKEGKYSVLFFAVLALCTGCKMDYERIQAKELASGKRYDSLFQGLYLGMDKADFRARCLQLNHDSIFTDGASAKILYRIKDLHAPATLLFFPDFYDNKIYQLAATLSFDAWAPWNKHLSGESLAQEARSMFMTWYGGNEFQEIKLKDKPTVWVKIDGNRRITILQPDDSKLKILIRDLSINDENLQP